MAKKPAEGEAKVNKSEEIRAYYRAHPRAKPLDVVAALGERGIVVSAGNVSTIRYLMKKKKKGRKAARAAANGRGRRGKRAVGREDGEQLLAALVQARKLADRLGGIQRAKQVLSMLDSVFNAK